MVINVLLLVRSYIKLFKHKTKLNSVIKHKRDHNANYLDLKPRKSYLFKVGGKIGKTPIPFYASISRYSWE